MQALTSRWFGRARGQGLSGLIPGRRGVARLHRQPVWRAAGFLGRLPRGAGLTASVLYLIACGAYGMVYSGKTEEVFNDTTSELGFRVSAVRITGQRELDEIDVLDTLSIHSGQSLFFYDAQGARDRLAGNPWISNVSVMKFYPDKLRVIIEERTPAALWQKSLDEPVEIVDGAGKVITDHLEARFVKLPRVIGDGAETRVHEITGLLDDAPDVQKRVRASMLVSHRRWDLFLDNGVQVMLPERNPEAALAELQRLEHDGGLLDRDLTLVDLRLSDRLVVRLTDTAKAARDELVQARTKAMKQRARDA
ncbi:cell division protein FtsQ/DivIB [Oharaeibacter diazotrophicus]|uniref:Cell division protein FtsQ n=1 Tax=Oharaeibacter diazotrophicus TaxID=1920512 RepID=A0A4R6RGH8_9HYPH|nr:FtsQ-type POTRA domain-containing protein [Oharaeibacter diazotrophicus]TDP85541.1 cell division protein FtsQ [Oharaeibacter diazotrophicus]BBE74512.1 cell division protein FtsQ [Pleomorphomonas sp. SM30]GLS75789.1 cell division protein FtsQ [Oharaeibacter diazotrophicus]